LNDAEKRELLYYFVGAIALGFVGSVLANAVAKL
jgi:hypothetical protein